MFLFQLGNSNYNGWTNLRQIYHSSVYIVLSVKQLGKAKLIDKTANFQFSVSLFPFCLCLPGSCWGMDRQLKSCRRCRHCRFWLKLREEGGSRAAALKGPMTYASTQKGMMSCRTMGDFHLFVHLPTRLWFEGWGCWFEVQEGLRGFIRGLRMLF